MNERFALRVDAERVLQLLSSQIYDSPKAMLRENVQNAYDASLMRSVRDGTPLEQLPIDIHIGAGVVTFVDRGIGMTADVLRDNYWSAGSSGKTTELARRAGVVGTFGIGAMANFGVAERLEVETQTTEGPRIWSGASISDLSFSGECINSETKPAGEVGTIVRLTLKPGERVSPQGARKYLEPFVQHLPLPVRLNGVLMSGQDFFPASAGAKMLGDEEVALAGFDLCLSLQIAPRTSRVTVMASAVKRDGRAVGRFALVQDTRTIDGYRSGFRLAAIPVGSEFQWGGKVDLALLQPTAGREALTRDSIGSIVRLVGALDEHVARRLSASDFADTNLGFLNYVRRKSRVSLAGRVTIKRANDDADVRLDTLADSDGVHFYTGTDASIIDRFSSGRHLLLVSNRQPRRWIQDRWLRSRSIPQVPDRPTIGRVFVPRDLSRDEFALKLRLESVLADDYLLPRSDVVFAEISHGVAIMVDDTDKERPRIHLARDGREVTTLLDLRRKSADIFIPLVKDFARNTVYRHVQALVPSSTRMGAEALMKSISRRKELYRYASDEVGPIDRLIADLFEGKMSIAELSSRHPALRIRGRQGVSPDQVGRIDREIPTLAIRVSSGPRSANATETTSDDLSEPMPGILRLDTKTSMKVLVADESMPQLGNHRVFLGLTDRASEREGDFFIHPHFTRVIWAQHRVVFVIQTADGRVCFYYDIQLKEPIAACAGGRELQSASLLTATRIFVPLPRELEDDFAIQAGRLEFYVSYDYVTIEADQGA